MKLNAPKLSKIMTLLKQFDCVVSTLYANKSILIIFLRYKIINDYYD